LGIGWFTERPPAGRPSVSVLMTRYRREWMRHFVERDPRIFDENPYFLRDMQRNDIAGDFIVPTDDRFAWVPLYRRDRTYINPTSGNLPIDDPRITYEDASVAQIVLFGVEVRNRTRFSNSGTFIDTPQFHANNQGKQYNLQPRPVAVRIQPETAYGGFDNSTYVLEVFSVTQLTTGQQRGGYPAGADYTRILNAAPNAMAEGSFVVISDDRIIRAPTASTPNAKVAGSLNGRIFRVGAQRTDLANPSPPTGGSTLWDLYPGYEFKPEAGANGVFNLTADATQFKDDIVAVGVSMTPPPSWYGTGIIGAQQTASAVEVEGTPANQGAVGLIIGRGLTEAYIANSAAGTTPQYEGLPMDVSVYTTVIKVK
ncbi:MAG TPA: hypothetical protein PLD59_15870, partial [Tepidisphaeraceae bacterium]|nr:hypothetical protein [Tepidisphaeraceae bacterium]